MVFNAVELAPELTSIANVNDDAAHLLFVRRADQAISLGQNPVDFWVPDVDLGFPEFVYYQHLPHLAVVAVARALLGTVDIAVVFNAVRYVLLVGLPLTVFWSMRRLGFSAVAAAVGAAASSLLSSGGRLGFDYDSYVWRGFGVFTQLFAMHLSFVTLAALRTLLDRGRGYLLAVMALSALVLSHLLYAYMMAISAAVLWVAASWRQLRLRALRLAAVGTAAAIVSAYLIVPDLLLAPFQSISPYLESFKYDSFGAQAILGWLVSGELLDAGRLPVLTVLLGIGAVAAIVTRARPALIALALAFVWLVLYFGRPTLGILVDLFPMHQILFFQRFIGGFHLASILVIGFGGAWLWEIAAPWRHPARVGAIAIAALLAFIPLVTERAAYYDQNARWLDQTRAAIDRDVDAQAIFATLAALPPGRVYAGQRRDWGEELDFGIAFRSVRLWNLLADREIAAFSQPYQGGSLNSDLVFDFDPTNPGHYAAFGVTYVIAPSTRELPSFLAPVRRTPLYTLYAAPVDPAAHYAAVSDTVTVPGQAGLLAVMRGWLLGPQPAAGTVVRIDYPVGPPRTAGASVPGCGTDGRIESSRVDQGRVTVIASCPRAAALVLPMTFHPNWHVTSDGSPLEAYMVTPSVLAVTLPPGTHTVVAEYRSTPMKGPLLALAGFFGLATILFHRRIERLDARLAARWGGG